MLVATMVEQRLFTVDEVLQMSRAGVFEENERLELVDGVLVPMSPEGLRHRGSICELTRVLVLAYPHMRVWVQNMLLLDVRNYRMPDFVVVDGSAWEHPDPKDVVLVVEVAHTSLAWDLGPKARAYAAWGVGTYWVLDVVHRQLVVHERPTVDGYRVTKRVDEDSTVQLPRTDASLRIADVLPPTGMAHPGL